MDRPEDEELFDSRNPPWVEQEEYVLPDAMLLADTTAVEEMLDAPEERIPQAASRPEGDAGEQVAAEPVPAPQQPGREQPMPRQERMERRDALRNQQNGIPMGQENVGRQPLTREQRQQARVRVRQQQARAQPPQAEVGRDPVAAPAVDRIAGPGGDPLAASPPRQQPRSQQERMEKRNESNRNRRHVAEDRRHVKKDDSSESKQFEETLRAPAPEPISGQQSGRVANSQRQERSPRRQRQDQQPAWRPPIFDQIQEVVAFDDGDEVPLGEPREIAQEDPQVAMNDTMGFAEAAYQGAEVAAEQSRYLHNTMSQQRDIQVGFMSKNYV